MRKEAASAYDSYMQALDRCIEVARKRAFSRIEDATAEHLLALDRDYLAAVMKVWRKRYMWVRGCDAADSE